MISGFLEVKKQYRSTTYEWLIEVTDEYGDINDHVYADKLSDLQCAFWSTPILGHHHQIVLVKTVGDATLWEDDSVDMEPIERAFAYPESGELVNFGNEDHLVPKRYIAEFNRNADWIGTGVRE